MWSSLPTSTAAARALRMHRPPRSTMCCSLAMCRARQSSPLPQTGWKGLQTPGARELNPAFPVMTATGVPRTQCFWQTRCRLFSTCGGFNALAVPGGQGKLCQGQPLPRCQGHFGGCSVQSQGSRFPPMGRREHQRSLGSCLPHCQRVIGASG